MKKGVAFVYGEAVFIIYRYKTTASQNVFGRKSETFCEIRAGGKRKDKGTDL